MAPRIRSAASHLILILLAACSDATRSEPCCERTPAVIITGSVHDPDASPLPYVSVAYRATPAPDSGDGAIDSYGVRGLELTDSLGDFVARLGFYSIPTLDSLQLVIGGERCSPYAGDTVVVLGQALAGLTDTVLHLSVTLPRAYAQSRWSPGPLCAHLVDPSPLGSPGTFQMWVDSIGPTATTWGRFRLNYEASVGDDIGTFVLEQVGDSLVGTMIHRAPWGSCATFRLALRLHADSTLGEGAYTSTGCPTYAGPLAFVPVQALPWPGP